MTYDRVYAYGKRTGEMLFKSQIMYKGRRFESGGHKSAREAALALDKIICLERLPNTLLQILKPKTK